MLIDGQKFSMTPSETSWVASALVKNGQHDLARNLVRARREAIAAHLPPGLFDGIAEFPRIPHDPPWWSAYIEMTGAELKHAKDERGNELNTITVDTPDEETLTYLQNHAESMYAIVRERTLEPRKNNLTEEDLEDYDPNDPEEIYYEAVREATEADLFDIDLHDLQIIGGIAAALKARRQPDQNP